MYETGIVDPTIEMVDKLNHELHELLQRLAEGPEITYDQ